MDMIYISHPYTGNEEANCEDAERIAAELSSKYQGTVFVNPLNAMRHLKDSPVPYDGVICQCIELLSKCDGIIMTGEWGHSEGCKKEYAHAKKSNIRIWKNLVEFGGTDVMPNDCCGSNKCCGICMCSKCAERLACWNCNDCTRKKRSHYAVGFTGRQGQGYVCSRFRKEEKSV